MDEARGENVKDCVTELWEIFEKTGSIAAYILYTDMKKRSEETKEDNEDRVAK
jgi:hypothetical protein